MSLNANSLEFIVWHFVRTQYEDRWNGYNVPLALKYLIKDDDDKRGVGVCSIVIGQIENTKHCSL